LALHDHLHDLLQAYETKNSFWRRLFSPRNWFGSNVGLVRNVLRDLEQGNADIAASIQSLNAEYSDSASPRFKKLANSKIWETVIASNTHTSIQDEGLVSGIIKATRHCVIQEPLFMRLLSNLLGNFSKDSQQTILSESLFHMMGDQGEAMGEEEVIRGVFTRWVKAPYDAIVNINRRQVDAMLDYIASPEAGFTPLEKLGILGKVQNKMQMELTPSFGIYLGARRGPNRRITQMAREASEAVKSSKPAMDVPQNLQDLLWMIRDLGWPFIAETMSERIDFINIIGNANYDELLHLFIREDYKADKVMEAFVAQVDQLEDDDRSQAYHGLVNKAKGYSTLSIYWAILEHFTPRAGIVLKPLPVGIQLYIFEKHFKVVLPDRQQEMSHNVDRINAIATLYHALPSAKQVRYGEAPVCRSHVLSLINRYKSPDLFAWLEHISIKNGEMAGALASMPELRNQIFVTALQTLTADCQQNYPKAMEQFGAWISQQSLKTFDHLLTAKPVNPVAVNMLFAIANTQSHRVTLAFMDTVARASAEDPVVEALALASGLITKKETVTTVITYCPATNLFPPASSSQPAAMMSAEPEFTK